jgi:integrase
VAPLEPRSTQGSAFGAIVERYLLVAKAHQTRRTYPDTERYLRVAWRSLHPMPVDQIQRRHVASMLPKAGARNARAALSACFNWAIREGLADANPVAGTNRPTVRSRDRILTDAELAAIWHACRNDDFGRIVRLLLLTGQRRDEVGAMAWAELRAHPEPGVWVIPGARTKNKRAHEVPLTSAMLRLLPERRGEFVFGRFKSWSHAKAALDRRSVGDWRLHDLRRTAATRMADLGVQPHIIEAVLNHVSGSKAGVSGIYNRSTYSGEKRRALELWSAHVLALAATAALKKLFP